MVFDDLPTYLNFLLEECSKLESSSDVHSILKSLYKATKKCPVLISNLDVLTEEECEIVYSIIKSFLLILLDDNVTSDELLLCGTCIVLFVSSLCSPDFASSFLLYILCHLDLKISGEDRISDCSEDLKDKIIRAVKLFIFNRKSKTAQDFKLSESYFFTADNHTDLKTFSFYQVAILNGIVSCQIYELYSFPLKFDEEIPFLIFIFDAVYQSCLNPSIHQYHAFIVLLNWTKICEACLHKLKTTGKAYFATNGKIIQNLLNLLESNWQSPVKGINGFIKELYKRIIKLNQVEYKNSDVDDVPLCPYLLEKTMMLSWQVKGKYFILSAVLEHMDYKKFFQDNPDAPSKIIFNLKANYISSSVAETYKVIVTNMKRYNSEEQFSIEWCRWWREPILMCLSSGDKLLIQNTINNVLSWTIKQFPKFYELMMDTENLSENDSNKLLLLRVAKENCPLDLGDKELALIEKNLHHGDIQIRSEILSILCSSPKKSEPVKLIEIDYVKTFILHNLNIDSAPFHQYLLSQLNTLLIRIRDSLAQEYRSKSKCELPQLEFVDWLTYTAVQNTFPGACFQRRRLCLQMLNVIYDVFIESLKGLRRKENPSKSVEQVISWAQKNNLWLFFSNDLLTYILPCITDFADEIRSLCAKLLRTYSSWPEMGKNEDVNDAAVTKFALILCNHPDYRNNDGGAHICDLIFHRLCLQSTEEKSQKAIEFLKYLISVTKLQLETAKEDFLFVAVSQPIHGMLLALQYCITNSKNFFKSCEYQKNEIYDILKELMYLCFSIVDYMLNIMKGENENFFCPSFSDISKAMEKIVLSKKDTLCEIFENSILEDEKLKNGESSNYGTLCDLLLSCCWHSIKNSCFLLSELASLILAVSIQSTDKKKFLQEVAEEFSSILISCRHRGVVEACCNALNNFCLNLQQDKSMYYDITMGLLKGVFENLHDTSKVSVTRRSAGLPLLFQAVVSSEENNVNRQLLPYTIGSLLKLINKPFPSADSISEKTDIPQAHAYHILKALVSEARLSQSILPYFDSIIPVCITGFSSNVWAIRNGALQLFGVILPRVCGQKKVRDDDSEHNLVSAFELFARCPSLKTYLLKELAKCVEFHREKRLCSQLVPILSLLVKLMPEREDQRIFISDFIPLLNELLNTPVWKVRELVSLALSVLMLSSEIIILLEKILHNLYGENVNVNLIHSMLLIVHNFMKRKRKNISNNVTFIENNMKKIYTSMRKKLCCPLLLGITIEMMLLISEVKEDLAILECIEKTESDDDALLNDKIGFSYYESKVVLAKLKMQTTSTVPLLMKNIKSKNKEVKIVFLQFLSQKLSSERSDKNFYLSDSIKLWEDTFICTIEFISSIEHPTVTIEALKFMTNLSSDDILEKNILYPNVCSVMEYLEQLLDIESGLSVAAHAFTLWSICIRSVLEKPDFPSLKACLEKWNLLFYAYCQPRSNDILRMQAATSLAILGPSFMKYLSSNIQRGENILIKIFLELCEGSLLLLQDEDEDVRNVASKFPSQIPHHYKTDNVQFNIGIQVVFQHMTQVLCDEPFYVLYLWNRLQNYPSTAKILLSYCNTKKRNLFEQEYVNVFAEPHQLLILYLNNLKEMLSSLKEKNYELYRENISLFLHDSKSELEDVSSVLSSVKIENSDESFVYHHRAYLSLKKLRCQLEVLYNQTNSVLKSDNLYGVLLELQEEWSKVEKLLPTNVCWFLNVL